MEGICSPPTHSHPTIHTPVTQDHMGPEHHVIAHSVLSWPRMPFCAFSIYNSHFFFKAELKWHCFRVFPTPQAELNTVPISIKTKKTLSPLANGGSWWLFHSSFFFFFFLFLHYFLICISVFPPGKEVSLFAASKPWGRRGSVTVCGMKTVKYQSETGRHGVDRNALPCYPEPF